MNKEALVEELSNLTVLEMSELKEALEEKWGVKAAAAPVAVAAVAAADDSAKEDAKESTEFELTLSEVPADKKIAVIKVVKEILSLGLKEAKELVESAPKVLKESAAKVEADEMKKKLEDAGAKVALKGL